MMRRRSAVLLVAFGLMPAMAGCARNPATGGTAFTGGMTAKQEVQIGRDNHAKILKEFGGEYGSPQLRAYVNGVGQLLARTVERKEFPYRFTIINSPIVNAFATPGGYIYLSRGLLALADNEAQLAAVLAHELGHITGLHHAKRHGQTQAAGLLMTVLGAATGNKGVQQLGQVGIAGLLSSFSREHEYESDELGIRYLARAGYDPGAMAGFLSKLRAHSRLEAKLAGKSPDEVDQFSYLATHPAPAARVTRARRLAAAKKVARPMTARAVYLKKIDGIVYGDDPAEGIIRGREFLHPKLGFRFTVPQGFKLKNSPRAVLATGPSKAQIVFDHSAEPFSGPLTDYLSRVWGRKVTISGLEAIQVNGMPAATGTTRVDTKAGRMDLRLLAIRPGPRGIYRFRFFTPPQLTAKLSVALRRTSFSFRRLGKGEAARVRPNQLHVVHVKRGDTVTRLAARTIFADMREARFRVLNGLADREPVRPGQIVKLVQ